MGFLLLVFFPCFQNLRRVILKRFSCHQLCSTTDVNFFSLRKRNFLWLLSKIHSKYLILCRSRITEHTEPFLKNVVACHENHFYNVPICNRFLLLFPFIYLAWVHFFNCHFVLQGNDFWLVISALTLKKEIPIYWLAEEWYYN